MEAFQWGAAGKKLSPSQAKKYNDIAAALAARGGAPSNVGEGLNRVGEALLANSYSSKAAAGEEEGAAARKAVMDALMGNPDPTMADIGGALGNEWVTSDPGSSAVLQALLGAEVQQNDPLRQQQLAMGEIELNNARNPPAPAPDYGFIELPDGSIVRTDGTSGGVENMGQFGTPPAPDAPTVKTIFDPATGREQTVQWNGTEWAPLGGVAAPKDPMVQVNTGDQSGASGDFYKGMDADLGEQQALLIDAGRNASSNNARLGELERLLATAPQGAAGSFVQMAGQFGIPMEGLSEVQAAQALINQMVPGQRPPGSGTMSDADLALFKQSLPSIANQPGGNMLILQTAKAVNEYTIAQAAIAQQVANREISPAEGRALQAAIPNPLADFKGASQAPAPNQSSPADIDDILKGYGL
jgi:hypothetical protein